MSDDLTRAEMSFLREHAPVEVRRFVSEVGPKVHRRTEAYRKVAAAAKAERVALMEVRRLDLARLDDDPRGRLDRLESQRAALEAENERLRSDLTTMRALPSMAVHSDD